MSNTVAVTDTTATENPQEQQALFESYLSQALGQVAIVGVQTVLPMVQQSMKDAEAEE